MRCGGRSGAGMGQVSITINGRTHRLRCDDGEEARVLALADHVRRRLDDVRAAHGQVGEERMLLMAALLVCDEFFDARDRAEMAEASAAAAGVVRPRGR